MLLRFLTPFTRINTRTLLRNSISINRSTALQLIKPKPMSTKSESEWKVILTPEQFHVLRQKGEFYNRVLPHIKHGIENLNHRNGTTGYW